MVQVKEINVEEMDNYLRKGAIVTLEFGEAFTMNVKSVGKFITKSFLFESYGEYPIKALHCLLYTYNVKLKIYKNLPETDYCPALHALMNIWCGREV